MSPVDMNRPKKVPLGYDAHDIENLEIQPSSNGGFAVRCRRKAPESESGEHQIGMYQEPELKTFDSVESLNAFISKTFEGGAAAAEDEA